MGDKMHKEKPTCCVKCGDTLKNHEDDGYDICRWCVTGWKLESTEHSTQSATAVVGE